MIEGPYARLVVLTGARAWEYEEARMAEKKTHFGRAGEYFAMSELLLRGWNVAVPVVDVGDDVFVVDDHDKTTRRLQVKSATGRASEPGGADAREVRASFKLSRRQLRTPQPIELFYMFVVRLEKTWRFLVVPRVQLLAVREAFVAASREGVGRPPLADDVAKGDTLSLQVVLTDRSARGWGAPLTDYLDQWPDELAPVVGGPGGVGQENSEAPTSADGEAIPLAEDLAQ